MSIFKIITQQLVLLIEIREIRFCWLNHHCPYRKGNVPKFHLFLFPSLFSSRIGVWTISQQTTINNKHGGSIHFTWTRGFKHLTLRYIIIVTVQSDWYYYGFLHLWILSFFTGLSFLLTRLRTE